MPLPSQEILEKDYEGFNIVSKNEFYTAVKTKVKIFIYSRNPNDCFEKGEEVELYIPTNWQRSQISIFSILKKNSKIFFNIKKDYLEYFDNIIEEKKEEQAFIIETKGKTIDELRELTKGLKPKKNKK